MILKPLDFVSSASLVEECLQHVNLESSKGFSEKGHSGPCRTQLTPPYQRYPHTPGLRTRIDDWNIR